MINSRKKIIYITSISTVVLAGIGVGAYFISTSFSAPTTNPLQAQYFGATAGLNVPYDINSSMSFNDWLLINMPSKLTFNSSTSTMSFYSPTVNNAGNSSIVSCNVSYTFDPITKSYSAKFSTPQNTIGETLPLNEISFNKQATTENFISNDYNGNLISNFTLSQTTTDVNKYVLNNYNGYNLEKSIATAQPSGTLLNNSYTVLSGTIPIYSQSISGLTQSATNSAGTTVSINVFTINIISKSNAVSLGVKLSQNPNSLTTYDITYTVDGSSILNTDYNTYYSKVWSIVNGVNLPKEINMFGLLDFIPYIS